jgi:hypothetical protein
MSKFHLRPIFSLSRQTAIRICALIWLAQLATSSLAILPPPNVECCQAKDYQSDRCAKFTLSAEKCETVIRDFAEFYRKFMAAQQPVKSQTTVVAPSESSTRNASPEGKPAAPFATTATVVARVETRLYYHHSGTFSPLIDDKMTFWNVIIGEGGAAEPSSAVRVDVVLKGAPGSFDPKTRIALTVSNAENGKVVSKQTAESGVLSDKGEYHAIFLLQRTGCIPLKITARIEGSPVERAMSIPFRCGE